MGTLIPEDFDLESVEPSLARVAEAFRDRLDEEWLILPHVPFVERGADGEVDLVVFHPSCGGIMLEVKGGAISVRNGVWYQNEHAMKRSPFDQVVNGKHALVRKIQRTLGKDALDGIRLRHAVVFPDVSAVPDGALGPDVERSMVLTQLELEWPEEALRQLNGEKAAIAAPQLEAVVKMLRPTIEFSGTLGNHMRGIKRRLGAVTDDMIRTAENLDGNDKVLVLGPAGVGKTRLATSWARRASARGERVLLTCYNIAIGSFLTSKFENDPNVVAGPFMELVVEWLAESGFPVPPPEGRTQDFWDRLPQDLIDQRGRLAFAFDTIIVDEVQDIKEPWFPALHSLLDPSGPRKEFYLGDENQRIFNNDRLVEAGWTKFPMTTNCRNTRSIAEVARRLVPESQTFPDNPPGPGVRFHKAGGTKEVLKRVRREIDFLIEEQRVPPSTIAVISTGKKPVEELIASTYDDLADGIGDVVRLVSWDDRDEDAVVCETAHKLKGTEWQAVILVNLADLEAFNITPAIYVGVTRATTWLTVVGTAETGELLGLQPLTG